MNRHERGLEFKVGIFVFLGCAALAGLVMKFGRLGEGVKTYYQLNVKFGDASGLLKGSDVLLAGARIGRVSGGPRLVREGPGVIDEADSTMASAKKAADDLQNAIVDTRKLLRSAMQGKGLVATLLNDRQLANDLHALISNLRAHGVLFYRDSAGSRQPVPPPQTPTPSRRAPNR